MSVIPKSPALDEVRKVYHTPLLELAFQAAAIHREFHNSAKIKLSQLISIKTGSCVEDCMYCAQSSRYKTHVQPNGMLTIDEVLTEARHAKEKGLERVCLSASWRDVPEGKEFDDLLFMIEGVKKEGLSVCCTTGMINAEQAEKLHNAGITAYNHNLDTSDNYYQSIITTRSYKERLKTIEILIDNGVQHCTGGIIGMGESEDDRISLIHQLATLKKHPYTVPINMLVPIKGTPLENKPAITSWEMIRMISTVRIFMPSSMICLAAGRLQLTDEAHALCFLAGANSIFVGTKLLTTPNPEMEYDQELLKKLGLTGY